MTRPTQIGRTFPLITATGLGGSGGTTTTGPDGTYPGSGQVPTSTGSNTWAWASNVARITSNTSNAVLGPFVDFSAGSNIILAVASNTVSIAANVSGGSTSITANTSNTITPVNLVSGAGILFGATATSLTISNGLDPYYTINAVLFSASSNTAMTPGWKGDLQVDTPGTIEQWSLLADQSGSVVVDIKKDPYSGFPPTTSITASAKPTITSASKAQSGVLTGWTTSLSRGDILRFNVDSCTTITQVTLALRVKRTI